MHLGALVACAAQLAVELLDLELGGGEHDDAPAGLGLEEMAQDGRLLTLVAHDGRLVDAVGRTADGNLHLGGMVEYLLGHLLDFRRHGGREHERLARGGRGCDNLHDVVVEAHVEHTVGLVEDEHLHLAEVDIAHAHVGEQAAGGGDDHVGAHLEAALLLGEGGAVGAAVDGHGVDRQKVGKALHLAVDLLGKLARGRHHYAVDGVGLGLGGKAVDYGQEVGGRFAGSGLGHRYKVAPFEHGRDGLLLDGRALAEVHRIERVENVVTEV